MSPDQQIASLTIREREALAHLADGCSNKVGAHRMGISDRTFEIYRANAMEKTGATSFARLLQLAFAAGMGEPL